jgi:hypothetical protein
MITQTFTFQGRWYSNPHKSLLWSFFAAITLVLLSTSLVYGLPFDSGSDESDGALDFTGTPAGTTIEFDPVALNLDADGDSIYHFTTITVPADVTIKFRADKAGSAPIHWLATGPVVIDGTLDLNGENGSSTLPTLSISGPGGFPGGAKAISTVPNFFSGFGPGAGIGQNCNAGHVISRFDQFRGCVGQSGSIYGNGFLLPLIGGSGGAGHSGGGGGAGGGAILCASNVSVTINGTISARGGDGGGGTGTARAGGGSGGAVRIVAPNVSGAGTIDVRGQLGGGTLNRGSSGGRILVEASINTFAGQFTGDTRVVTLVPDPILFPSTATPNLSITSIGGIAVPATPRGLFNPVDVSIDNAEAVVIAIAATNIPLGTVVNVTVLNETEGATSVSSTPLDGTLASSNATASMIIRSGFSRFYTDADWNP